MDFVTIFNGIFYCLGGKEGESLTRVVTENLNLVKLHEKKEDSLFGFRKKGISAEFLYNHNTISDYIMKLVNKLIFDHLLQPFRKILSHLDSLF